MFFLCSVRSPHRTAKPSRGCLPLAHPRAPLAVVVQIGDRRAPCSNFHSSAWGVSIPPVQVWFSTAAGTFLNENPGFASAPPLALHRALRRRMAGLGFSFWISGCWRALAKGTAWAGLLGNSPSSLQPRLWFSFWFSGRWRALAKGTAWTGSSSDSSPSLQPRLGIAPPFADAKFDMNDDGELHVPIASCCSGARAAAAELLIRATSFGLGLELGWTTSLEGGGCVVRGSSTVDRADVASRRDWGGRARRDIGRRMRRRPRLRTRARRTCPWHCNTCRSSSSRARGCRR